MPSESRRRYQSVYKSDVTKLRDEIRAKEEARAETNADGRGRRHYGHLGRSAVVMLCASLESYIENVMKEVIEDYYLENIEDASRLPDRVKMEIGNHLKKDDHNQLFKLTGSGWKNVYVDIFNREVFSDFGFSTPKPDKINNWMYRFIGYSPLNGYERNGDLLSFVEMRGEIAHNGSQADYVGMHDFDWYVALIDEVVKHIDTQICLHLRDILELSSQPWRNT